MAAGTAAPDVNMPELPAWLETLRSSERPGGPGMSDSNSKSAEPEYNFSASDLVDEGMLPSWMRPERSQASDTGHSEAYPARRSASKGAPNIDNFAPPQAIMSASSLIDEQALPEWMREKSAPPQQPQPGVQDNIAATSLLQSESLPEWMRTMQPPTSAPAPSHPVQYEPMAIPPEGIMGNDLIDPQSLPQWMTGQETPAPLSGQKGFSASALLDETALPSWLRNAGQELPRGNDMAFPAAPQPAQSIPLRPSAQPIPQVPPAHPAPPAYSQQNQPPAMPVFNNPAPQPQVSSNLPASSFIDMNALPGWLKPAGEQPAQGNFGQQQQGAAGMGRQASFGVPARPENVRVPSRPRAEMGPYEESEVAANVFASMLGVASPNLPGQQRGQASAPVQPPVQQQPMPQQPQQWTNTGNAHGQGMPAGYGGPQNPPNQQGQSMNQGYAPGNVAGNMPSQQARPMNPTGMQPGGATMQVDDSQAKASTRPAKRGFLSTILEWFSFSR